ncbi:MAG: phosphoribosylglycinamide formyltransferase [Saprospiraceae bacterium]
MIRLAVFASGSGSNARRIMEYFAEHPHIRVALLVCNKPDAGAMDVAREHGVETLLIRRKPFAETTELLDALRERAIDFIALAGFLWLLPPYLVRAFPRRILNIHPSLLPKYGGKGMYGMHVHEAVKAAGETVTGMTIHYVNERYDEGDIVFQATCAVEPDDSAADIARKVLALEHAHYPEVIERTAYPFSSQTT